MGFEFSRYGHLADRGQIAFTLPIGQAPDNGRMRSWNILWLI
jgi:hypothetical protein